MASLDVLPDISAIALPTNTNDLSAQRRVRRRIANGDIPCDAPACTAPRSRRSWIEALYAAPDAPLQTDRLTSRDPRCWCAFDGCTASVDSTGARTSAADSLLRRTPAGTEAIPRSARPGPEMTTAPRGRRGATAKRTERAEHRPQSARPQYVDELMGEFTPTNASPRSRLPASAARTAM